MVDDTQHLIYSEYRQPLQMLAEQLVILSDLSVGQRGAGNPERVIMDFDQNMGALYPFSLDQKLERTPSTTLGTAAKVVQRRLGGGRLFRWR